MLNAVLSMSTARRLAAGLRIFPSQPPAARPSRVRPRPAALESGVLLAQLLEPLGGIGVHPAIGAAPVVQRRRGYPDFGGDGDLLANLALGSQLIRAAQLAHDVLRGMPL